MRQFLIAAAQEVLIGIGEVQTGGDEALCVVDIGAAQVALGSLPVPLLLLRAVPRGLVGPALQIGETLILPVQIAEESRFQGPAVPAASAMAAGRSVEPFCQAGLRLAPFGSPAHLYRHSSVRRGRACRRYST